MAVAYYDRDTLVVQSPQLEHIARTKFEYVFFSNINSISGVQMRTQTSLDYNEEKYFEQIFVSLKQYGQLKAFKLFKDWVDYNSFIDISFDKSVDVSQNTRDRVEISIELMTEGYYLISSGYRSMDFVKNRGPLVAIIFSNSLSLSRNDIIA